MISKMIELLPAFSATWILALQFRSVHGVVDGTVVEKSSQASMYRELLRREQDKEFVTSRRGPLLSVRHLVGAQALKDVLPEAAVISCSSHADWAHRTCRLRNLCFDTTTHQFLWNPRASETAPECADLFSLTAGGPLTEDTVHCLDLLSISPDDKVVDGTRVAQIHGVTALLARRHAPSNAGHFLMQTATALERLANDYGVKDVESRLVVFADGCNDTADPGSNPARCLQFTRDFASPLSAHPPVALLEPHASLLGSNLSDFSHVCFADVVSGLGRHSPFDGSRNWENMTEWVSAYREKMYIHNHMKPPVARRGQCNVVFTWKEGVHGFKPIANQLEVDHFLASWAQQHGGLYHSFTLKNITLEAQLSAISTADMLVTVPGSTAFSAFFLAPGTELVYLDDDNYESAVLKQSKEYNTVFVHQDQSGKNLPDTPEVREWHQMMASRAAGEVVDGPGLISLGALGETLQDVANRRGCALVHA